MLFLNSVIYLKWREGGEEGVRLREGDGERERERGGTGGWDQGGQGGRRGDRGDRGRDKEFPDSSVQPHPSAWSSQG